MAQRGQLYLSPCSAAAVPIQNDQCTTQDESSPLLAPATPDTLESQAPSKIQSTSTPLPKAQLMCLCAMRLVDPIAFTQIFPYINEMMAHLHLTNDPSRVGFYSGLAESAFSVSSLFSIYQWARLSDVIGRRPVIFIGIIGVSLATLLFGLQQTLLGILLVRSIGGFFSGNAAVIYSALGEITDSTNHSIALPIFALAWPIGSIIGPLIGGTFSDPANTFPKLFSHDFFRAYPYFLPGCVAALISLTGAIFGYFFLEETLPSKRRGLPIPESVTEEHQERKSKPYTFRMLLSVPIIRALCYSGAGLSFMQTAFEALFVLFCYSPIQSGGLSLSAAQIGICLAIAGLISCVIQLFVTPVLFARFDPIRLYNGCLGLWPYCFLSLPLLNIVARIGLPTMGRESTEDPFHLSDVDPRMQAMIWCGITASLTLSRVACLAFGFSIVLVKENTPTPDSLGATNGLVLFAMSLTRSFCPAFASWLFVTLANSKILFGYLWAVIMASIAYACSLLGSRIVRPSAANYDRGSNE